jgi:hypothetical protein
MNWYKLLKLSDKRSFLLSQGYQENLVNWALSLSDTYAVWLLNLVKKNDIRPEEDDDNLRETLAQFDKLKRLPQFTRKDINSYKSYGDLARTLDEFTGVTSKREQVKVNTEAGIKLLKKEGEYEVYIQYCAHANRASNVPIDIYHSQGVSTVNVNQRINGGQWNLLGGWRFFVGESGYAIVRTGGTDGYVIADAFRFVLIGGVLPQPPPNAPVNFQLEK